MKKLCITTGLLAGVSLVGTSVMAENDLSTSQTRDNTTRVRAIGSAASEFAPAGADCVYDNHNPLDDFGSPASQKDSVYPFYAEAADDFTLPGDPANGCILDSVAFATTWFNVPVGVTPSPAACWAGVNLTVYEDSEAFCGPGFVKGPAGEPLDAPPQGHIEYCPGGVVCEIKTDMANVIGNQLPPGCTGGTSYEIIVSGLQSEMCVLEKDHKYWMAIAPQQQFAVCGQTGLMISANESPADVNPCQQIFLLLALPWTPIDGNGDGCPPTTPPLGTRRDLSMGVAAVKEGGNPCPWDLLQDGVVDAGDLAQLLGAWGNPYGPAELAQLLGAWGPCP